MSLNFNLGKIKDWQKVCHKPSPDGDGEVLHHTTDTLIKLTMAIDIGVINDDTVDEFWYRVHLFEKVAGASLIMVNEKNEKVDLFITEADVKAHLGLSTNVTYKSRKDFIEKMKRIALDMHGGRNALNTRSLNQKEAQYCRDDFDDEVAEED